MKDAELYAKDVQGTLVALHTNPAQDLLVALNVDPTVTVSGSISSTVAVGPIQSDVADTGDAPLKVGGIARTANPTAVGAGDMVSATYDDIGRQVMWPYQVRDLVSTARASATNVTETTLLAGVASTFLDLVYVIGANSSNAAVSVDIRDTRAGGIVTTLNIPANSTSGVSFTSPLVQNEAGNSWTFQNSAADDSNTTITLSAQFIRNV